jgi:hypothetical protein
MAANFSRRMVLHLVVAGSPCSASFVGSHSHAFLSSQKSPPIPYSLDFDRCVLSDWHCYVISACNPVVFESYLCEPAYHFTSCSK